jgi:valyl-tRNA synthetase
VEVFIPLEGLIDKESEIKRLNKEIEKLMKEIELCQQKLNNPNYVNKAPKDVVEKEQARLQAASLAKEKLEENRRALVVSEGV